MISLCIEDFFIDHSYPIKDFILPLYLMARATEATVRTIAVALPALIIMLFRFCLLLLSSWNSL